MTYTITCFLPFTMVAALGVLVSGCGGGHHDTEGSSIAQAYANELRPNKVARVSPGLDPDQEPESSADDTSSLLVLPHDRFKLTVTNTSDTGFINRFSWAPPANMTVSRVIRTEGATCSLAQGKIVCAGALAPPKCSCEPGGSMFVVFAGHVRELAAPPVSTRTADGKFVSQSSPVSHTGVVNGVVEVDAMTLVPHTIPSHRAGEKPQADIPICKHGEAASGGNCVREHGG